MPLLPAAYRGTAVSAVFDNLLPDRDGVRRRLAERMGAPGTDFYSLLQAIGRDCVGAMQFLPEGTVPRELAVRGEPLSDADIEAMLADLAEAPLGLDCEQEFRISVAGAQEKTALLLRLERLKRLERHTVRHARCHRGRFRELGRIACRSTLWPHV